MAGTDKSLYKLICSISSVTVCPPGLMLGKFFPADQCEKILATSFINKRINKQEIQAISKNFENIYIKATSRGVGQVFEGLKQALPNLKQMFAASDNVAGLMEPAAAASSVLKVHADFLALLNGPHMQSFPILCRVRDDIVSKLLAVFGGASSTFLKWCRKHAAWQHMPTKPAMHEYQEGSVHCENISQYCTALEMSKAADFQIEALQLLVVFVNFSTSVFKIQFFHFYIRRSDEHVFGKLQSALCTLFWDICFLIFAG